MKKILILSKSDFQSTFRDPLFKIMLFFPFISFAIIRFLLPVLVDYYPPLDNYTEVVLMWACIQSASMFGMIYGFLFLEEKEESLWQVLRILPVKTSQLILARLLLGLLISVVVNYLLIHFGNVIFIEFWKEMLLAVQFSLVAPLVALIIGAYAKNRIEGLAQIKIINLLLIVPALIYFIPGEWIHLTALVPTYWTYRGVELVNHLSGFLIFLSVGFFIYFAAIAFLQKKLFR